MSSEVYYDKAFISVGGLFIPLVCRGSTNTYEFSAQGRAVAERYWSVLDLPYRGRLLFTSEEIQKIAETYEGFSNSNRGGMRRNRNSAFEAGEFQRWFLAGLKNAHTIEEYRQYGNSIVLTDRNTQKKTYASTTEAFLTALSRIGEQNADIRFDSCRSFYHPPRVRKQSKFDKLKQFYVLRAWSGYFVKRTRHGVMTIRTADPTVATVRKFRTERAAQKYMAENAPSFSRVPFSVECVQSKEALDAA